MKQIRYRLLLAFWTSVFLAPVSARAVDKDDLYGELVAAIGLNQSGWLRYGAIIGFSPRNDFGVGLGFDQNQSKKLSSLDRSSTRGYLELRWFQEPFEFSADVGLIRRSLRTGASPIQPTFGVSTAYLWALTPGLAAKVDFAFLFLDEPRVTFSGGLGARVLF